MRLAPTAAALSTALLAACGAASAQEHGQHAGHGAAPQTAAPAAAALGGEPVARAALKLSDGSDAGVVTAYRGPEGLLFRIEGINWPGGWHATHLHAVGTCEGPAFTSAGSHTNHATAKPHGLLNPAGPDLGDLQNVFAHHDGKVHAEVYGASQNLLDANGTSFLVHENPDDQVTQPIGGAGARIACGVFEAAE